MNNLEKIREKLRIYNKKIIDRVLLEKILIKFAPNYSVRQISNLGIISPLKRGKYYFNNLGNDFINPYIIWALYMEDNLYVYGGLWIYNHYSFTTQIAEWYTIYNTKISGKKIIWNTKIIFKRQRESFFYGVDIKKFDKINYNIMSPERAFIERMKEWDYFSEIPNNVNTKKLIRLAEKNATKTIQVKIKKLCL